MVPVDEPADVCRGEAVNVLGSFQGIRLPVVSGLVPHLVRPGARVVELEDLLPQLFRRLLGLFFWLLLDGR